MYRMISLCTAVLASAALFVGCGKPSTTAGGGESAGGDAKPETVFVTFGTGSANGLYYPTGNNVGKMVTDKEDVYGIKVDVQTSGGSGANVTGILNKELDFGIVQSDIQYQAYNGQGDWAGKPQTSLRAVFAIHPEIVTLIAADDAGVTSLADLKGKAVNLGEPGSGSRINAEAALKAAGLDPATDVNDQKISTKDAPELLKDDRIDAFFFTVGHPNGAIQQATAGAGVSSRKVSFVPITGEAVDKLLAENPYFAPAVIPVSHYENVSNTADVPSFAVKATLMTRADVSDDVVYAITKEVFENLDQFRTQHPAYAQLTPENMLQGLSAPLHPGAERYYREAGLLD